MSARVAVALLALACATAVLGQHTAGSAGWSLTAAELKRLEAREIVAEGDLAAGRAAVDIRAAVQIDAPPEQVFRTLTDCAQALRFVPHLKRCVVAGTAPDGSWQEVEHTVDYGWLAPRAHYAFRADYEGFERIRFRNLRGDFRENHGVWELGAIKDGRQTLVTYSARIAPAFYVPRWTMRSMLKRDLPELMRGLRARAEATRPAVATSAPSPATTP